MWLSRIFELHIEVSKDGFNIEMRQTIILLFNFLIELILAIIFFLFRHMCTQHWDIEDLILLLCSYLHKEVRTLINCVSKVRRYCLHVHYWLRWRICHSKTSCLHFCWDPYFFAVHCSFHLCSVLPVDFQSRPSLSLWLQLILLLHNRDIYTLHNLDVLSTTHR